MEIEVEIEAEIEVVSLLSPRGLDFMIEIISVTPSVSTVAFSFCYYLLPTVASSIAN